MAKHTVFCLYCNEGFEFEEGQFAEAKLEVIMHDIQCEKNPLVKQIVELKKELESLRQVKES